MPSHGPPGDPHGSGYENPWRYFVEDDPDIAYNALRPQQGANSFLDYWRQRAGRVRQDYMGQLGQMALRGEAPSLEYVDFLGKYPWMRQYMELGPENRGGGSNYTPGLRWFV
mgnify:CR=1 FL=1